MKCLLGFLVISFMTMVTVSGSMTAEKAEVDCLIEPHVTVELSSPVAGVLEEILVERGDVVNKDQVIARLQSGVEEASVRLARARAEITVDILAKQAQHAFNKRSSERLTDLVSKQLAAVSEQDDAETKAIVAEYEVKSAQENKRLAQLELERAVEVLRQRTLRSTVRGVVMQRLKGPGEYVEAQPVMKIAQLDPLNVEVIAPLSMLGTIKKGMHAEVALEQPVGGKYIATVVIVDRVVDAGSGTFGVRLELANPDFKIPAGVRCSIDFREK